MFGFIKKTFIGSLTSIVNASGNTKCILLSNQQCKIQPTLIIYILTNTVKDYIIIHSRLTLIDVLEVVILLITYLIEDKFQIKLKI